MSIKKVIIADTIKLLLAGDKNILHRADLKVLTAKSNDEILALHRVEKANLIITHLDLPGMLTENLLTSIRGERELRTVALIMLCTDRPGDTSRAQHCNVNAVLTLPLDKTALFEKTHHILNIPWRESYRVLLSVSIEGMNREQSFFCKSENISSTGLLLETDRNLKEGDRLTCAFFLPDSKQITVSGNIVRKMAAAGDVSRMKYGVKFDQIASDARKAIDSFVKKKSHRPN
ncbi:MAG TPA: PilZ domain-containing protein [Nitrospirota bacterium]|nr:PilZ domain-containing protein [Nitrospirota bacterium]